jgi:hypothetical protein
MTTNLVSAQDGGRWVVGQFTKDPTLIPALILDMTENQFLVDSVLRNGGGAPAGIVGFWESTPLYSNDDPAILDEFGEIPTTTGSTGTPRAARVVRRARAIRISKTMRDRNRIDLVNIQLTQLKNTMIRAWEDALFSALVANANVQTLITDTPWGDPDSHIRRDVNGAKFLLQSASADAAGQQRFGFRADTLIIDDQAEYDFLDSDEVTKPYIGNIADENLLYTGKLPNKFLGLDVLRSWRLSVYAPGSAIVCQRKVMGAIYDERPLESTGMYPEGNGPNGGPREAWRNDTTRASAIAIDQPKAVVIISGVTTGETRIVSGDTITAAA